MKQKVYFAGSIRGGRKDVTLYQEIINHIKQTDLVLTEHIGNLSQSTTMKTKEDDIQIYQTDMEMLEDCDTKSDDGKSEALKLAIAQITKQFGDG